MLNPCTRNTWGFFLEKTIVYTDGITWIDGGNKNAEGRKAIEREKVLLKSIFMKIVIKVIIAMVEDRR